MQPSNEQLCTFTTGIVSELKRLTENAPEEIKAKVKQPWAMDWDFDQNCQYSRQEYTMLKLLQTLSYVRDSLFHYDDAGTLLRESLSNKVDAGTPFDSNDSIRISLHSATFYGKRVSVRKDKRVDGLYTPGPQHDGRPTWVNEDNSRVLFYHSSLRWDVWEDGRRRVKRGLWAISTMIESDPVHVGLIG